MEKLVTWGEAKEHTNRLVRDVPVEKRLLLTTCRVVTVLVICLFEPDPL